MRSHRKAVEDGRAMVRVRRAGDAGTATAAVCPGCWNSPARRPALIAKLAREGLAVAHTDDGVNGRYRPDSAHAPGCPWRKT
jgi:hypothetical protein